MTLCKFFFRDNSIRLSGAKKNKIFNHVSSRVVFFREELKEYVYNNGKGKDIAIKEIVQKRTQERAKKARSVKQRSTFQTMLDCIRPTSSQQHGKMKGNVLFKSILRSPLQITKWHVSR